MGGCGGTLRCCFIPTEPLFLRRVPHLFVRFIMALSVEADETALEMFRRANRKPLRTGLAFLDEVKLACGDCPFFLL